NAATNTAISVFEVGVPHDNKKVIFYNLKDDGFVLSKSKGRTNAYGKWDKIRNELLDKLFNPHKQENLIELNKSTYFLEHEVFENSEWVIQEYAKTDYDNLSYKDFVKTIKDFIVYRVKKELDIINIDLN
ncbi:TPA: hypothetical protein RJJ15_002496, partial [Staphylococcus pseudintermedius]|nr:hypothetical protein [Staphylococcus pseudintermedius]